MDLDKQRMDDLAAIEDLHQRDMAATAAFDVDTLLSLCTDDVVVLPPGLPARSGKTAGREFLEAGRQQGLQVEIVEFRQEWEEIQVIGDFAFEWGVFHSAVRPKEGGTMRHECQKVLRVLRRDADGAWKVHRTMWNEGSNR